MARFDQAFFFRELIDWKSFSQSVQKYVELEFQIAAMYFVVSPIIRSLDGPF